MISLLTREWSLSGVDSVTEGNERQELLHLTTEIVASFAGNNTLAIDDLPAVIATVLLPAKDATISVVRLRSS